MAIFSLKIRAVCDHLVCSFFKFLEQTAPRTSTPIAGSGNQSRSQWSNKGPTLDRETRQKRRQQYAGHVWHVHPTLWNERLQQILREHQFESSIEAVLASTIPAQQR